MDIGKNHIFSLLLIIGAGVAAYGNSFGVPFQFDDRIFISENPLIKDPSFFASPSKAEPYVNPLTYGLFRSRYVGFLSFGLNAAFSESGVAGFHVVNLAIHLINAFLVYRLVLLTFRTIRTETPANDAAERHIALASALLFVCHPLQTEAVTYIWQRVTSLAAMFSLLSLERYAASVQEGRPFRSRASYLGSIIFAVLAMKTKETAFTLPVLIALYDFMFMRGPLKPRIFRIVPLFATMLIIPLTLVGEGKSLSDIISEAGEASRSQTAMSRLDYLATQLNVVSTYIRLILFPVNQNLDYDYPVYDTFTNPAVILSFMFLAGLGACAVYLAVRSRLRDDSESALLLRLTSFGIFWFFISLSVESSVIPIVDVIFEHRVYLPSAGFFISLSAAAFTVLRGTRLYGGLKAVFLLIVILTAAAAYARNEVWGSEVTLWEDVVRKSPDKKRGRYNLANEYRTKGYADKAIEQYLVSLSLVPDDYEALNNLGATYASKGLNDEAIAEYQKALSIKPDYADAHFNLAAIYIGLGKNDSALAELRKTLELNPDYPGAAEFLGYISKSNRP